jgi:quinol monooxygenase YgiN
VNTDGSNHPALYLVATLVAAKGSEATLLGALRALVPQSRREPGCIQYDLHEHTTKPDVFVMYEIWKDQEALDAHVSSNHFQSFLTVAEPILAETLDVKVLRRSL